MSSVYRLLSPAYVIKKVNLRCYMMNNETPERLSKGVKHTKSPSELVYNEMNIHVNR